MRKKLLVIITFVAGIFYFCEYFMPHESGLKDYVIDVGKIILVIGALGFGLGVINLLRLHLKKVLRRRPGWFFSLSLTVALFTMAVVQTVYQLKKGSTGINFYTWIEPIQNMLFISIRQALSATVFALLAFYMASAAYRAFRIKSMEAALMMTVALIIMLGNIPIGQYITEQLFSRTEVTWFGNLRFDELKNWIMGTWNVAAQRGVLFGVYIGGLAMTLRIWLSLERGSFFD